VFVVPEKLPKNWLGFLLRRKSSTIGAVKAVEKLPGVDLIYNTFDSSHSFHRRSNRAGG
jgi:hypothetical protein